MNINSREIVTKIWWNSSKGNEYSEMITSKEQ